MPYLLEARAKAAFSGDCARDTRLAKAATTRTQGARADSLAGGGKAGVPPTDPPSGFRYSPLAAQSALCRGVTTHLLDGAASVVLGKP